MIVRRRIEKRDLQTTMQCSNMMMTTTDRAAIRLQCD
jgi:hypothetical protein